MSRIGPFIWYLTVMSGFMGSAFPAKDLGPLTIFPYRVLMIMLWGITLVSAAMSGKFRISVRNVRLEVGFFGFWFVYAVLSFVWAQSTVDALRHVTFLFMGVSLIFFATNYIRKEGDLRALQSVWLLAAVTMIVIGFWEHFTGSHLPHSKYWGVTRADLLFIPTGVWVNPNDFATFLSIVFPFILGILRHGTTRLARWSAFALALAVLYLIVASRSRANMIAVLLQLGFLLTFLTTLPQKLRLSLAAALAFVILFTLIPGPLLDFTSTVASDIASVATESARGGRSISTRADLIRNSLSFVHATAGLGVGAGNAEYWMVNRSVFDTGGITNVHNWWFEILTNYGFAVFCGYVAVYLRLIRRLWLCWHRTRDRQLKMFAEAPLLALVGFSIAATSSSSIAAFHPNWLLFAFAIATLKLFGNRADADGITQDHR